MNYNLLWINPKYFFIYLYIVNIELICNKCYNNEKTCWEYYLK